MNRALELPCSIPTQKGNSEIKGEIFEMPLIQFGKPSDAPKRSNRPSLGHDPSSSGVQSQSHSRIIRNEPSQSRNTSTQLGGRSHSDYPPASRRITPTHNAHRTHYQVMEVSPIRESGRSHISSRGHGNRPVSPLGSSRFEQPSPWSNRRAPSGRPRASTMRDEYGFSIRNPSHLQGNQYGMSAHAPFSTDEYECFEPRGRHRGYSEVVPSQSRRNDNHGAGRSSNHAYNMQSDFRKGGFSDWMNY